MNKKLKKDIIAALNFAKDIWTKGKKDKKSTEGVKARFQYEIDKINDLLKRIEQEEDN